MIFSLCIRRQTRRRELVSTPCSSLRSSERGFAADTYSTSCLTFSNTFLSVIQWVGFSLSSRSIASSIVFSDSADNASCGTWWCASDPSVRFFLCRPWSNIRSVHRCLTSCCSFFSTFSLVSSKCPSSMHLSSTRTLSSSITCLHFVPPQVTPVRCFPSKVWIERSENEPNTKPVERQIESVPRPCRSDPPDSSQRDTRKQKTRRMQLTVSTEEGQVFNLDVSKRKIGRDAMLTWTRLT